MSCRPHPVALLAALGLAACSGRQPGTSGPVADSGQAGFTLTDPSVFSLGIPADFFASASLRLPDAAQVDSCHVQGMAIAGDLLVLSCVLFDRERPETRSYRGRSLLLSAPLAALPRCANADCADAEDNPASWRVRDLTAQVPTDHSVRITRQLLDRETLSAEESAIGQLMTHPSGLDYDAARGGVWLANACYAPDSFAEIMLVDVRDPSSAVTRTGADRELVTVTEHIGAVVLVDDRYLLGWSWGSARFAIFDTTGERETVIRKNPFPEADKVDYQDCAHLGRGRVACGGYRGDVVSPDAPDTPLPEREAEDPEQEKIKIRTGRVHIIEVDTSRYPDVTLRLAGHAALREAPDKPPTRDLGVRRSHIDKQGTRTELNENQYGTHRTPVPLSYEAMAISRDGEFIYFVPEDLPDGRLIRYRLN